MVLSLTQALMWDAISSPISSLIDGSDLSINKCRQEVNIEELELWCNPRHGAVAWALGKKRP